jgi:hypothetical protein
MRQVLRVGLLAACAAVFLLPVSAYAQVGQVAGQVKDASGGALPGVLVEVSSPQLIEKVRSTTTDGNGRYQITALPVGTYDVKMSLSSFATYTQQKVAISSDFTATVDAVLKVGGIEQNVTVTTEPPVVDVVNARQQTVFTGEDVANLPTQRDIPSLLLLVPGITTEGLRGTCNGGIGIFCNPTAPMFNAHASVLDNNGLNGENGLAQGLILVDGLVVNAGKPGSGFGNYGATQALVLDTAQAQEVSFTLSGSLGESETGGASINVVPRTGGNRYAGNFYTSYMRTGFFSRNRDTRLTSNPDQQEYNYDYTVNGAFGGPVMKDRLWFYLYGQKRESDQYPNGGAQPGFSNLNEGKFAANYVPNRNNGWLTFSNEYKNASVRLTVQATQRNKFNIYWDEQDSCTNPCHGMINLVDSPEAYFSLMSRPNRIMQLSWTNPFTNRLLFDAGISVVASHIDSTKHRDYPNYRALPRVCETGPTVGRDEYSIRYYTGVLATQTGIGSCSVFFTMNTASINDQFPGGTYTVDNQDTYRSRASASYITGSHNAKIGYEGGYYSSKVRNEVNDLRMSYMYMTPQTTGTWNATNRQGNCLVVQGPADPYACGNMTMWYPEDQYNLGYLRPRPTGFQVNTGVGETDERAWFGAMYIQDQWTLNRFTLNGALRWDHAESRYGETCIGPDPFVPTGPVIFNGNQLTTDQPTGSYCTTPTKGVRYNDITPRWGVAWDVFGNGKTSLKWNMGKYVAAANLGGLYTQYNDARRSTNLLQRGWDDRNGNRLVECDMTNPAIHTSAAGDYCGTMLDTNGNPSAAFLQFGRPPGASALANNASVCGITQRSSALHQAYCEAAGQNLMAGWGKRRSEWQLGIGVQHELLPRLSVEVTYNRRSYSGLTDTETINSGCDYYTGYEGSFLSQDWKECADDLLRYKSDVYDFFGVQAPVDPRLPNGGGYWILGNDDQKQTGSIAACPPGTPIAQCNGGGAVTLQRKELHYSWNGVDTNFVLRARGGLRISGGTSTGRSNRSTCYTDLDNPNVVGREGNDYGGGCKPYRPFQTNVRANAAYTIPYIDVLAGVVFQYRPGSERSANLDINSTDVVWQEFSQGRAGTDFNTFGGGIDLLDFGDLYGEGFRQTDLNFGKNFRFGRKRVNIGVNVYNLFNTDAATGYENDYTAFRMPDNSWVTDNPNTAAVEVNEWGNITSIATPRFMRLQVTFDF